MNILQTHRKELLESNVLLHCFFAENKRLEENYSKSRAEYHQSIGKVDI